MWQQNYTPIADSIGLSTVVAAIPIFVLLFLLGVKRKPAGRRLLCRTRGDGTGGGGRLQNASVDDRDVGHLWRGFRIVSDRWVVFSAILLYRVTIESGKFDVLSKT